MSDPEYLQALRETEMEIYDVIDSFCRRHGIRFSIVFGTLLGAVRHKGFIPWDDDIDLAMSREDYERFLETWKQAPPEGYILQNKRTNWDFTQNFTKIRKDHTTFLQGQFEKTVSYHTGIFVDIFPADRVAKGKLARKWQVFISALNLLYARGFTSKSTGIRQLIERMLLAMPEGFRKKVYYRSEKAIGKWNRDTGNDWFFADVMDDIPKTFRPDLFDRITEIPFEGKKYGAFKNAEDYLRVQYGADYMQPPPEAERVFIHNHSIISLDKNRDELNL